ncbi:unnamed protein product [Cylindrotheca closterium]|uniref:Uncharacterized protein n=1 Tax=Cylindrotheca closterium TaxID=2856 RepID=A0AAD2FSB1_9STRA|nr:unnamed protein product [Cylindrotheca closterium]
MSSDDDDSKPSSSACCEKVSTDKKGEQNIMKGNTSSSSFSEKSSHTEIKTPLNAPQTVATASTTNATAPPTAPQAAIPLRRDNSSSLSQEALEKKTFLIFVKILFKLLKEHQGDEITTKAKRVVMECRRHNQQNHPAFTPLMEALERHLRRFVGEKLWGRAHSYLHHYLGKEQEQQAAMGKIEPRPLVMVAPG